MTPYYSDEHLTLYGGDCRAVLAEIPAESVHTVVTSPPYWGLRDYGTATWDGGDPACDHLLDAETAHRQNAARSTLGGGKATQIAAAEGRHRCKCGAIRQDSQLGLEATPEEYVEAMVGVFREVRRVLRADGTLWLNLGDSYASSPAGNAADKPSGFSQKANRWEGGAVRVPKRDLSGLKPKDLVGIPWAVARALQAPYYTGRMPNEADRRWLAAMIDGEGSINGFHHIREDDGSPRTGVHVCITNSSTALLDEAARIWPASRSEHQRPGAGHLGTRTTWRWLVHGIENKALVLRELYPHLIAKRRQALLAYNLTVLMADAKRLGHTPQRDEVRDKRRLLVDLMSRANHGEPVDVPSWCVEPPGVTEPGWYLRSDIIWSKPNPMPESVTDRPTKAHEYVFLLSKSPRYYFDADAVREADSGIPSGNGFAGRQGGARQSAVDGGYGTDERFVPGAGRNLRSVWTIATEPYPGAHFATFPRKLVEPCVKAGCPEGGVVLDPFAGSGTTLLVAQALGRRGVGIDLNPDYLRQALDRNRQAPLGLAG